MSGRRVLLVLNCQRAASYGNRALLTALYGERFEDLVFVVGEDCAVDLAYPTLTVAWEPRIRAICPVCPARPFHPAGFHHLHPRLLAVAGLVGDDDILVFVEDDCVLSPRWNAETVRERCAGFDALTGALWWCDPDDDRGWCWPGQATGFAAFHEASCNLDRQVLERHWRLVSGQGLPPRLDVPVFGGFVDCLMVRGALLRGMAADLAALGEVWHELAIPTALLAHTPRLGLLNGHALWGPDRQKPLGVLLGMLADADFVHPIKLRTYLLSDVMGGYARIGRES